MAKQMYIRFGRFGGGMGFYVEVPGMRGKFFGVRKCGGKARARVKALGHARLLVDRSRANPETGRFVKRPSKAKGVFRHIRKVKAGGKTYSYPFWAATASPKRGKQRREEFSVNKHGEAAARELARSARRRMVKDVLA